MLNRRWRHGAEELAVHPWWQVSTTLLLPSAGEPPDYEWRLVEIHGREHGRSVLGHGHEQACQLRLLLAEQGEFNVLRLSDQEVTAHVGIELSQRRVLLFKKVLRAEAVASHSALRMAPLPESVERTARPAIASRPWQPTPAPHTPPESIETDFELAQQGAQTATLRLAAVTGVPFCAVCAKLKHERASTREAN